MTASVRPSGPTVRDKEFYLDRWDYADPVAIVRFAYLTASIGREGGGSRLFWSHNCG